MKKIIRLTESDLTRIVKRVIKEDVEQMGRFSDKRSFLKRGMGKVKDFFTGGFNEKDSELLEYIKSMIANPPFDGAVEILMDNDKAFMTRVAGYTLHINKVNPKISVNNEELKLGEISDVESEIEEIMNMF